MSCAKHSHLGAPAIVHCGLCTATCALRLVRCRSGQVPLSIEGGRGDEVPRNQFPVACGCGKPAGLAKSSGCVVATIEGLLVVRGRHCGDP